MVSGIDESKGKNLFEPVDNLDPRKFYEYQARARSANAVGLERFVYRLLGPDLISSVALAIDPMSNYRTASGKIDPVQRTRDRSIVSVLDESRIMDSFWTSTNGQTMPNYGGRIGVFAPFLTYTGSSSPNGGWPEGSGLKTQSYSVLTKDTTKRTRTIGTNQGEFETFKFQASSPTRTLAFRSWYYVGKISTVPNPSITTDVTMYLRRIGPVAAVFPVGRRNDLKDKCDQLAQELIRKHAISMFKDVNPWARQYTLFRNIVELRDLPRSILQARSSLREVVRFLESIPDRNLAKAIGAIRGSIGNVPKEYLSFKFGWEQLYRAVNDLVELPQKMAKKVNFVIQRNGKPTRSRVKRDKLSGTFEGLPGFEYTLTDQDYNAVQTTKVEWKAELRLVVDSTLSFPTLDEPKFRKKEFARRLGLDPTISDVYNLTPWTWLLDWFTGTGQLIQHMENMYSDRRLINWGLFTVKITGKVVTTFHSEHYETTYTYVDGMTSYNSPLVGHGHASSADFVYQTRRNAATLLDNVGITSLPSTLTDYQKSIISALVTQRGNIRSRT